MSKPLYRLHEGFWPRPRGAFLAEAEAEKCIFEVDQGRGGAFLAEASVDH